MSRRIKELILQKSLKDLDFARNVLTELPSNIFENDTDMKSVFTVLKRQVISSTHKPTQEGLAIKVEEFLARQKKSEEDITDSIQFLNGLYDVGSDKALKDESVVTEMEKYIKAEMTKDAIMKAVQRNDIDDVEKIGQLGDKITKIAVQNLSGSTGDFIDFFKDIEAKKKALSEINTHKFPTGFKQLDQAIEGGLSRGELGTISGMTGGGKSMVVSNLVRNYVQNGFNVLHVALEEKMDRIILRSEQQMFGIKKSSILNQDYTLNESAFEAIQKAYKTKGQLFGSYFISKHMPQEISPAKLEQIIVDTMVREDVKIDVVIIDYPELMLNPYSKMGSESEAGSLMYEFIRKTAQEYKFMCWTLSQVNRYASKDELITKNHIEGSKRKLNSVEIHVTINQTEEEFEKGYLRLYLDKLRNSSERLLSKVIPMKVIPETMSVRDCNEEELRQHGSIMDSDTSDGSNGVFNKKKQQSANDRAREFNSMMN